MNQAFRNRFELSFEEVLNYYPHARQLPERDKYCVNYLYIGHWRHKNGDWPKSLSDHYENNYYGTLARMTRWEINEKSNTISFYSKEKINREKLNFIPFTVVRCPYKRLISAYSYLNGVKDKDDHWFNNIKDIFFDIQGDEQAKFLNFIKRLEENSIHINNLNILHLKSMHSFIKDSKNNVLVKEILRHENLNEDLNSFLRKYGYEDMSLPYANVSEKNYDYMNVLNTQKYYKDIVYNFYKEDFDFFNYCK